MIIQDVYHRTMSMTCTTPLEARLSRSMMLPTARSLEMVSWRGKVVTYYYYYYYYYKVATVSFSPAPVTSGVEPAGKLELLMSPFVMCRNSVSCSSFGLDSSDWNKLISQLILVS